MKVINSVTSDALQRVFYISVGMNSGTGFIVETTKSKYMVTAKHLFDNVGCPIHTELRIKKGTGWESIDNRIYYHDDSSIDVAVIETSYFDGMEFGKVECEKNLYLSQEVFMLGFPYGMENEAYDINRGFPIPLVKKGIVSGFMFDNTSRFYIDWNNNQGFSGGPVVCRQFTDSGYSDELYIVGIIKGYRINPLEVEDENGKGTGKYVKENSGIGIAHNIQVALQIIESIDK